MQFKVVKFIEASQFERVRGAILRTAIYDKDMLRSFGRRRQTFNPTIDAGETGHLRCAIVVKLAGDAVGNLPRVRAAGAGINQDFGLVCAFGLNYRFS